MAIGDSNVYANLYKLDEFSKLPTLSNNRFSNWQCTVTDDIMSNRMMTVRP
jgi:hypothetical protein